jgi:uncharacterized protein
MRGWYVIAGVASVWLGQLLLPVEAQNRDMRSCLSITDVDARVDCLESSGATSPSPPTANRSRQPQPMVSPSFDCRVAKDMVERAICGDPMLADADFRLGQAYQSAIHRVQDGRDLQVEQRDWIIERYNRCTTSPGPALLSCVLEMTRARTVALTQIASTAPASLPAPTPSGSSISAAGPSGASLSNKGIVTPDPRSTPVPQAVTPTASTNSNEDNGTFANVVLFVVFLGLLGMVVKISNAARRKRMLIAKYGDADAARILAGQVWQGMTEEQLVDSWGRPIEIGSEVTRTKKKEIWKYGQTGKNRFKERVTLENGVVSGWRN